MHFVDDDYLLRLAAAGREPGGGGDGITDVTVEPGRPYFDIEVVSDLHLDGPEPRGSGAYPASEAQRLRADFVQRFKRLRRAFTAGRPPHLLVSCGDLVVGRRSTGDGELARVRDAYRSICAEAFNELRRDGLAPELVTVPGNDDAYGGGSAATGWDPSPPRAVHPYYADFARRFAGNAMPARPEAHPVASVFRVLGEAQPTPLAYVAVVGFDSNDAEYQHDLLRDYGQVGAEQLHLSRRLITTLRDGVAGVAPLYVVVVTHHNLLPVEDRVLHAPLGTDDQRLRSWRERLPAGACHPVSRLCATNHLVAANATGTTSNASGFLHHCQRLRASLVLHGYMHQRALVSVSTTPLSPGRRATELALVAAPAFREGHPASGMARVRLDLWKGQAEIAFKYDRGSDGRQSKPIQVIRQLVSASRVSGSERRLYGRVNELVNRATADAAPPDRPAVDAFARHVADTWASTGYVPLCMPDGTLPPLTRTRRRVRYNLLLLLREAEPGRYEILLSRHTPMRPSLVGEWDTLLLQTFTSIRNLLEKLHEDVIRQVVNQAEDMEKAAAAKEFDAAIGRILDDEHGLDDDIWLDQIREVATARQVKISPTNAAVTEYEYHLVALLPFVRRSDPTQDDPVWDAVQRQRIQDQRKVVDWLGELPSVRRVGERSGGPRSVPIEAIMPGGAGLRWEPAADPNDDGPDTTAGAHRRQVLAPGAVWFPLPETDELIGPWIDCPSILARNPDVMRWVEQELRLRRQPDGRFLPHLVLGQLQDRAGFTLMAGPYPFEPAPPPTTPPQVRVSEPARSTVEAMRRVEFLAGYDLDEQRPYADLEIRRISLVRRAVDGRDVILVFDATALAGAGADLSVFTHRPVEEAMGVLRPVQRYVLRAGLDRARDVNAVLHQVLGDDPWGFLRANWGGMAEPVTLTPPIVEQLHHLDSESDGGPPEFVLCDGNHRVVQHVWLERQVAAAVAVIGEPVQPYYARAFSANEWDITAGTVLITTPDAAFKHAARAVDLDAPDFAGSRAVLERIPARQRYRRYYRDLSRGFGSMGGQGGRYV